MLGLETCTIYFLFSNPPLFLFETALCSCPGTSFVDEAGLEPTEIYLTLFPESWY